MRTTQNTRRCIVVKRTGIEVPCFNIDQRGLLMHGISKFSRRSLLRSAVALAGAATCASLVSNRQARAQGKASKDAMKYQDHPNGEQKCSNCLQFVAPGSCKVVEGAISPNGYCIAWVKKA